MDSSGEGETAKSQPSRDGPCVVMFSGGRDSTIAAARLSKTGSEMCLVTISSGHLVGMDRVRKRIREMGSILAPSTRWIHVKQPTELRTDTSFYEMTCLPCHHSYVVVSSVLAFRLAIPNLVFGYATYQSSWPEQSPMAISRLTGILQRHGIRLLLPAYDIDSRERAEELLSEFGLSSASLEQKCLQQIQNVSLTPEALEQQIGLWEAAIGDSISKIDEIKIEILEDTTVGHV